MVIERQHFEQALEQLSGESKEKLYKRLKPFLKELNMNANTAAQLGFVVGLVAGAGRVGVPYLFPTWFGETKIQAPRILFRDSNTK